MRSLYLTLPAEAAAEYLKMLLHDAQVIGRITHGLLHPGAAEATLKTVQGICETCGTGFEYRASHYPKGRRFCGYSCARTRPKVLAAAGGR